MSTIAFGEVAPSVYYIIPAGWRREGNQVTTDTGVTFPQFPRLPTQVTELPAQSGMRRFIFTDNTIRGAKGELIEDMAPAALSIGEGYTWRDVLRQGGPGIGAPLVMGAANVYVAADVSREIVEATTSRGFDVFDPSLVGGRFERIRPEPAYQGDINNIPADWPWLWSDGTIRNFQGTTIISGTSGPLPTTATDSTPYFPPPATDGTRGGAGGTPVLVAAKAPESDPFLTDDLVIGRDNNGLVLPYTPPTAAGPGSGSSGGSSPNAPVGSGSLTPTPTTNTTTTAAGSGFDFSQSILGLPMWAWLAAAAIIVTRKKG